jgi:hypothetical protein
MLARPGRLLGTPLERSGLGQTHAQAFALTRATRRSRLLRRWFERNTGPRIPTDTILVGDQTITTQAQADALAGKRVIGKILLDANNLNVVDFACEWDGSGTGATLLQVLNGRTGITIQHFLLDGKNGNISYGLSGTTFSTGCLVTNGEIRHMGGDGIRTFKSSTYRHMYVHSFRAWDEARDGVFDDQGSQSLYPHTDGVQVFRSGNLVEECWIENTDARNATGALTLIPDTDEAITSFTMRNTFIDGGANVLYIDNQNADIDNPGANGQPTGLVFENLIVGRKHRADVWRHREVPSTSFTKTNVTYVDTGLPVEAYFLDGFNRANENLEARHFNRVSGVAGGLTVDTNKVRSVTTTQTTYLLDASHGIDPVNQAVEVDWHRNISTTGWLILRYLGENDYVGMQISTLKPTLYTKIGGSFVIRVTAAANVVIGDKIRVEARGQSIKLYHKDVLSGEYVMSAGVLTSGPVGMQARTSIGNPLLDNFAAWSLPA